MKTCDYCGRENSDDAAYCFGCGTGFIVSPKPLPSSERQHLISLEERRFWEQITFRQFAILLVRLQAVWILFSGLVYATYLPSYFHRIPASVSTLNPMGFMISRELIMMFL